MTSREQDELNRLLTAAAEEAKAQGLSLSMRARIVEARLAIKHLAVDPT